MRPTCPAPTKQYIASRRADVSKPQVGRDHLREQAPFWMMQAQIGYKVPNMCQHRGGKPDDPSKRLKYNGVDFTETIKKTQALDADVLPDRKYLAMGSFFHKNKVPAAGDSGIQGRYFLLAVGPVDWEIPNPDSVINPVAPTVFAPANSFILCFAGTENFNPINSPEIIEDFNWQPAAPQAQHGWANAGPKIESYKTMLEALKIPEADGGPGLVPVGPGSIGSPEKEITIVGHSLGGAQAQLAAVRIALEYKAKVRVITFESILAFTPESAASIIADKLVWRDPSTDFPPQGGKITTQRWVEDDSPLTAAPLMFPAAGPACLGLNLCCWPNKYRLVGCSPFNNKLGEGYISKALILSGFKAKPTADFLGTEDAGGGYCACLTGKGTPPYRDSEFGFEVSDDRTYVTKGADRLRWFTCFPPSLAGDVVGAVNHDQPFLLWMLYKGAYQNANAPCYESPVTSEIQKMSQYVPKVMHEEKSPNWSAVENNWKKVEDTSPAA